jgi:hypothetical protein
MAKPLKHWENIVFVVVTLALTHNKKLQKTKSKHFQRVFLSAFDCIIRQNRKSKPKHGKSLEAKHIAHFCKRGPKTVQGSEPNLLPKVLNQVLEMSVAARNSAHLAAVTTRHCPNNRVGCHAGGLCSKLGARIAANRVRVCNRLRKNG